jgi:Leucine-rich repeat (LRR) protein
MKKILLLLMTVVVTSFAATADVAINSTNFPDANFRAFLKSKYSLSYITTSQLNACTELVMNSLDIADLTGIEYFTQLTKLDCFNNKITSVDLSANTKLKELNLGYNKLSSINLSANTGLEKLYLHNNQLSSSLSIANHSKLELLWVHNNQHLIGINCSDDALRNLNVTNCISLTTLECYNNTSLTTITGLGTCVNLQYLDCDNCSISDLSTLSELNNLAEIYCGHNQLTSLELSEKITLVTLDVSGNTQLTYLLCSRSRLQSLDVTGCTALEDLRCFYNNLLPTITGLADCTAMRYLDCEDCRISDLSALSGMDNLEEIYCGRNRLTSLELSQKVNLVTLSVSGNTQLTYLLCSRAGRLQSLNVTGCTALEDLRCFYDFQLESITGLADCAAMRYLDCEDCKISDLSAVSGMDNLETLLCGRNNITTLNVNDKASLTTLSVFDNEQLTDLNCYSCDLNELDVRGCTALVYLLCFSNSNLASITGLADCTALTHLDCGDCQISDLSAVNGMDNLENLLCGNNKLTSLEISQKSNLTSLYVAGNDQLTYLLCARCNLTTLNVTGCTALEDLRCFYNNRLASITGLADCTALKYLDCEDCSISSLSALNGMTNLETLLCADNKLVSLTVSGNSQLSMLTVNRNPSLASLFCRACDLSSLDLSGCEALEYLDGRENSIASLDVTMCPELGVLMCSGNELTELNLVNNTMLIALWCNNNHLTELDLSHCSDEFYSLDCSWNQITSLDVSRFSELFQLNCRNNQIPSLNVANLPYLRDLWCNNNPLTTLDVSGCNDLELLNTASCQLASLNVADCPKLNTVAVYYNKLKGQPVSQFVSGLPQRPSDDKGLLYAVALDYENGAEGNHMTADQVAQAQAKNWDLFAKSGNEWIPYGGEMVRGDVNGDGMVTIADVTALIDALLAGQTPDAGDVNGDFNVTIADVTALIDGLLSGSFSLSAHAGIKTSISLDEEIQLTIDNEELQARLNRMRTR